MTANSDPDLRSQPQFGEQSQGCGLGRTPSLHLHPRIVSYLSESGLTSNLCTVCPAVPQQTGLAAGAEALAAATSPLGCAFSTLPHGQFCFRHQFERIVCLWVARTGALVPNRALACYR